MPPSPDSTPFLQKRQLGLRHFRNLPRLTQLLSGRSRPANPQPTLQFCPSTNGCILSSLTRFSLAPLGVRTPTSGSLQPGPGQGSGVLMSWAHWGLMRAQDGWLHEQTSEGMSGCPSGLLSELKLTVPWGHIAAKAWGSLQGPPVLCLHGWLDNANSFDRLIPLLPQGGAGGEGS